MPTIQTPATMAAAATALVPLVGTLDASGDATKRAKAALLSAKIDDALTQASNLASQDVLTRTREGRSRTDRSRRSAGDAAIAFATSVATFSIAVVAGNVAGATSQLATTLGSLGIVA